MHAHDLRRLDVTVARREVERRDAMVERALDRGGGDAGELLAREAREGLDWQVRRHGLEQPQQRGDPSEGPRSRKNPRGKIKKTLARRSN